MQSFRMRTGKPCQADDRILFHMLQPSGLTHAVTLLHVVKDLDHLRAGQMGTIKDRPFVLAEAAIAHAAA